METTKKAIKSVDFLKMCKESLSKKAYEYVVVERARLLNASIVAKDLEKKRYHLYKDICKDGREKDIKAFVEICDRIDMNRVYMDLCHSEIVEAIEEDFKKESVHDGRFWSRFNKR